jgi:hypothetical protein
MPCSGILGFRSARSVGLRPRSNASLQPHFCNPANLRFAYPGCKNVSYLERYVPFVLKISDRGEKMTVFKLTEKKKKIMTFF